MLGVEKIENEEEREEEEEEEERERREKSLFCSVSVLFSCTLSALAFLTFTFIIGWGIDGDKGLCSYHKAALGCWGWGIVASVTPDNWWDFSPFSLCFSRSSLSLLSLSLSLFPGLLHSEFYTRPTFFVLSRAKRIMNDAWNQKISQRNDRTNVTCIGYTHMRIVSRRTLQNR